MTFEQIELHFESIREIDKENSIVQKKKAAASPIFETESLKSVTSSPALLTDKLEKEAEEKKDYTFVRFNASSDYTEVQPSVMPLRKAESVFRNKHDNSEIIIQEKKIIFDNTEQNIKSALDIAQDKGWQKVRIKGGSKETRSELWFQANMRGMETAGYRPTKADLQRLEGAKIRGATQGLEIKPKENNEEKDATEKPQQLSQKDKTLSQDEFIAQARMEIMAELKKVMPMNEKEYQDIEQTVDKQLAHVQNNGQKINIKEVKEDLQKGLPLVRNELNQAARAEQNKKQQDQQKTKAQEKSQNHEHVRTR